MAKKSKNLTPIALFKRSVHSSRNMRQGLVRARSVVKAQYFPLIIRELSRNSLYKNIFATMTFPTSLDCMRSVPSLNKITVEGELIWTSSVLFLFAEDLKKYVEIRNLYYSEFEKGNYKQAILHLDDIEKRFGFSIWLLSNRILVLQITEGLESQKNLLENILSNDNFDQFIGWILYLISIRAEENISYQGMEMDLSNLMEIDWLKDYIIHHLLPNNSYLISDPAFPISVEESHPIIDRYETFCSMVLVYCSKVVGVNRVVLKETLEALETINDLNLKKILSVIRGNCEGTDGDFLAAADAYSEGRYEFLLSDEPKGLELVARSHAYLNIPPVLDEKKSFRNQIIEHMYNLSVFSADATISKLKLRKLAILIPNRSISLEIAAFLDRKNGHIFSEYPDCLGVALSLSQAIDNPWNSSAIDRILQNAEWLDILMIRYTTSSSIQLRRALIKNDVELIEKNELKLPEYRRQMYLGHIYYSLANYENASKWYLLAAKSDLEFVSQQAIHFLFKTHYANGAVADAVELAVRQVLRFPSSASLFNLENLAREFLVTENHSNSIDLAILLHLAIRYANAKLERELSNIYENIMQIEGTDRPSHFARKDNKFFTDRWIYFLRFVCIPRILDDTTSFDSVEDIDEERIAICQLLLLHDPKNTESYQSEIRALTRDKQVAALLTKMQTSKIYVDESGIRETLGISLVEPLTRYLKLLESPNLAYQAEKLSKRLAEMLASKGHPEFKDLKLPATEREGLFNAMLLEAGAEFALNPAYGLDTHVSTSIRHGAFEGHLRSALVVEDLLCTKMDKDYILPANWVKKIPNLDAREKETLNKILGRFTLRFEDLIQEYLKEKLHIRFVGTDVGMFELNGSPRQLQDLMESITPSTTVHDLTDRMIVHFWELTTRSLDAIRNDLLNHASKQMSLAFDTLVKSVEAKFTHSKIAPLIDCVARARTIFQTALVDVADWFQRPTDLSRDPFEIDVATQVSLQQIANCYVNNPINSTLVLDVNEKIDGRILDGLCEILFILLQNVIRHSGFVDEKVDVLVSAERNNDALIIKCVSKLAPVISIADRLKSAKLAMNNYQSDSAMKMARKEGGSGLSKVWRIAEFDLRVRHSIELDITESGEFFVKLSLAGVWA